MIVSYFYRMKGFNQHVKNIYWKMDEMSCLLVRRNREWFKEVYPKLETVWNTIVKERQDNSYVKRAPKKREKNN